MSEVEVQAIKEIEQGEREPFTMVELRLPGQNSLSDLAEVFGDDLQECVMRVNIIRPGEYY